MQIEPTNEQLGIPESATQGPVSSLTDPQWKEEVFIAWLNNNQDRLAELRALVDEILAPSV
jgi:hypothetical protein